jgi:nanoRNase/pAp phosphatase (c-di-AMP/oligoRNAs hydrolase)
MSALEQHNLRGVPAIQTAGTPRHQTKAEELAALLEAHRGERHIVVLQSFPDPDAIPQAADFLLTEENVHTAVVYGIVEKPCGGEAVIGSLRTSKATLNPDAFLKDALGGAEPGRCYGVVAAGPGGSRYP